MNHRSHKFSPRTTTFDIHQRRNLVGGASSEQIWKNLLRQPSFMDRLQKDPSLERLEVIDPIEKTLNLEMIKHLFINSDPTQNKKYLSWILDGYRDGGNHLLEDVVIHMSSSLKEFAKLTESQRLVNINLQQYCGLFGCHRGTQEQLGLFSLLQPFESDTILTTQHRRQIKKDAELIFEDQNLRIIHPKTTDAAMLYGKGTRWCTAAKTDNMFDEYDQEGPLWIILPKNPTRPNEKYQLHLTSGSMMDETDQPINLKDYQQYKDSLIAFLKNVDLEQTNEEGFKPIEKANNLLLIQLLLQSGADPSPILYQPNRNLETIQLALEYGADPLQFDDNEMTPLHYASDPKVIRLLLKAGVDPKKLDSDGCSSLYRFLERYSETKLPQDVLVESVQLLLDAGVDPKQPNHEGDTPLHVTDDVAIARILLRHGADPNARNLLGQTPIYFKDANMTQFLLEWGANPKNRDQNGKTPIFYADKLDVVVILVHGGAEISDQPILQIHDGQMLIAMLEQGVKVENKVEMVHVIKILLDLLTNTHNRKNKVVVARVIYDLLITPFGLSFLNRYSKFKETVHKKLLELIQEEPEIFTPYYQKIFA